MIRELTTDLLVLEGLVEPAGRDVVDIGCGGGALARDLVARGARVIGVDVSELQFASAVACERDGGARYIVGRAQQLPLEDGSADVAVFMRSFHHVAPGDLTLALREARRVLRPGGAVYVAEPLPDGDYFALTSLIEDELAVREAAQDALARAPLAGLDRVRTVDYDVRVCVGDLAALRARIVSVDPRRAELFDARRAEIAEAFQTLGEAGEQPGQRCFVQPMRADVLRPAAL